MTQHRIRVARPKYTFSRTSGKITDGKNHGVKYVGPKARR